MTLDSIRAEVQLIRDNPQDPEMQHAVKDNLYLMVLRSLAAGQYGVGLPDAWEIAREALAAENVAVKWSACA